ncbi:MAG TPA: histidine phosphatase family protein [Methylomirabilota bacterium]|jgi:probable phosphoglycerate mutase|nr:histidine phosphatase family protein [Methylomirabilota bacterium]
MRLFAVRHGATEYSRGRRFAGARDVPLTPDGCREAEAAAQALAGTAVAAVYASPLERARASAALIAKPHGLEPRLEPAFREMAFGTWEGLTRQELAAQFPREATTWRHTPHLVSPPGGETVAGVAARVRDGLGRLIAAHAGETAVLVSHAVVVRLIVLAALGLGPERLWSVDASPAGITEIEYLGDWATVHRMNTLTHLEGLAESAR